jgi:tetratricopeptide (TPR) repeat protein
VTRKQPSVPFNPPLSDVEKQLKWNAYNQLQQLLKYRRFARAIALVEGLAQRIPQDPEVRQWQAIAYQRWGRHLVNERQLDKARIYLKKALRTDPHNRSLWAEVERDFRRLERML